MTWTLKGAGRKVTRNWALRGKGEGRGGGGGGVDIEGVVLPKDLCKLNLKLLKWSK